MSSLTLQRYTVIVMVNGTEMAGSPFQVFAKIHAARRVSQVGGRREVAAKLTLGTLLPRLHHGMLIAHIYIDTAYCQTVCVFTQLFPYICSCHGN